MGVRILASPIDLALASNMKAGAKIYAAVQDVKSFYWKIHLAHYNAVDFHKILNLSICDDH